MVCSQLNLPDLFPHGSWYAMAMNSGFSGSEGSSLPTWVSLRNLRYSFLVNFQVFDPNAAPRQVDTFEELQGTVARVHNGKVVMSICPKLQEKEDVIEALP